MMLAMSVRKPARSVPCSAVGGQRSAQVVVAQVLGLVAMSLVVASAMHLSGVVHGRGAPFDADHAGIAEALIAAVLAVCAFRLARVGPRARALGLWGVGFAIVGFCWGLNITARGGRAPDIAYHMCVLPILVGCWVVLLRAGRARISA
jgi:hypothetical protein